MTKPRSDGKPHKLLDELGKAIGLLSEEKGELQPLWFLSAIGESKKLYEPRRRDHLLEGVASLLGDEDRRGITTGEPPSPWWYHLTGKVPIDVVLDDGVAPPGPARVPAVGVGARYDRKPVDDTGKAQLAVALWIRAWLLGVANQTPPLLHPLDDKMRPQVEGAVELGIPAGKGFLSSAKLAGGVSVQGAPLVDVKVALAGWKAPVGTAPRAKADPREFKITIGGAAALPPLAADGTGGPRHYLKTAIGLALYLARTSVEYEATKPDPGALQKIAKRLVDHLFPLFGGGTGNPITPFPLLPVIDGNSAKIADWGKQFIPGTWNPLEWNLKAPATALMHVWSLFKKQEPQPDQLTGGSLVAWLAGDDAQGGVGLHLDGELLLGNKGWISAGVVARKAVTPAGASVRARLDLAASLVRVDFDNLTVPKVAGPGMEISLALEPANANQPLASVGGVAVKGARFTARWSLGGAPTVGWRLETAPANATVDPAAVLPALKAALPDLAAMIDAAQKAAVDIAAAAASTASAAVRATASASASALYGQLLGLVQARLSSGFAIDIDVGDGAKVPFSLAATGGALTLKVGAAITATLGAGGLAAMTASVPIPTPVAGLGLALDVGDKGGKLDLQLAIRSGGDPTPVQLPLSFADLATVAADPAKAIEQCVLAMVKHLVVPAAASACLDGGLLAERIAGDATTAVTVGDVLGWAGLIVKSGSAWSLANAKDLVQREVLKVVADIAAKLAERKKTGVVVGAVTFTPETSPIAVTVGATGGGVGSSRVDLQACKLEYSIVSPK